MRGQRLNSRTHVTVRRLCIVLSPPVVTVRRRPTRSKLSIVDSFHFLKCRIVGRIGG